jgi:hypothetical protein
MSERPTEIMERFWSAPLHSLWTIAEVAAVTGKSNAYLYKAAREGALKRHSRGRYCKQAVLDLLDSGWQCIWPETREAARRAA